MFGLLHSLQNYLQTPSRLVSHAGFVKPCASLSFQISSQSEKVLLAHVLRWFMRGQVRSRTIRAGDIRHRSNNVAATEIIQLKGGQFPDVKNVTYAPNQRTLLRLLVSSDYILTFIVFNVEQCFVKPSLLPSLCFFKLWQKLFKKS
jgi:hypothetical protein